MSNIEENLAFILSSRYGEDVRQAIHDAIHDCYEDGKAGATDLVAREQIANLVTNAGSTDKDSELVDVRVGDDAVTYDSAGDAVRSQFSYLINALLQSEDLKIIRYGDAGVTVGGGFQINGNIFSSPDWFYTDFIPLDGYDTVYWYQADTSIDNNHGTIFLNKEHNLYVDVGVLGRVYEGATSANAYSLFSIPILETVRYMRTSFRNASKKDFMIVLAKKNALKQINELACLNFGNELNLGWVNGTFVASKENDWLMGNPTASATEYKTYRKTSIQKAPPSITITVPSNFTLFVYELREEEYTGTAYPDYTYNYRLNTPRKSFSGVENLTVDFAEGTTHMVFVMRYTDKSFFDNYNVGFVSYAGVSIKYGSPSVIEMQQRLSDPTYEIDRIRTLDLSIFKKIGVIGDSISCGWIQGKDGNSKRRNLWISWPQQLARLIGSTVYNLGASGVQAITWFAESFSEWNDPDEGYEYCYKQYKSVGACDLYIIGLGLNGGTLGSLSDINQTDYESNGKTIYGQYARIIQMINDEHPDSIVLCLTEPTPSIPSIDQAVRDICGLDYINAELIDLENDSYYNALFTTEEISEEKQPDGFHYTPHGYSLLAKATLITLSDFINKHSDLLKYIGIEEDA